ncbi:MAG: acetate--CoA ligase family protein, partial [Calditrichia bacterium]|nr:acetate--CoA ligase family protein [Calditrichia bacterium]
MKKLDGFFKPNKIAIIGASRTSGSLGKMFIDSVLKYNYTGELFPVNPKADEIEGVKCYPSIDKLPDNIDMGVILVRKDLALGALEQCGQKGIKNIIVITAGFKEVGGEGIEREEELIKIANKYEQNIIGPNCMGLINTNEQFNLNASFSPTEPDKGNVAFISQSGALAVAILEFAKNLRLGFSIFVSMGNKADLKDIDFIEYVAEEDSTKVITLYQESIENARDFMEKARKISAKKPMIILKAGKTSEGQKAASSHTGALASSDTATQAMFDQCGIIRVNSVQRLCESALAFSTQPIPKNDNICVITNAGGPGILAADAISENGLKMASLSKNTTKQLQEVIPEEASAHNPVDMIASANHDTYAKCTEIALQDENVGAVMVIIVRPPVATTPKMIIESIAKVRKVNPGKPVFFVVMAQHEHEGGELDLVTELSIPIFDYPESAAEAIADMRKYDKWQNKKHGSYKKYDVNSELVKKIIQTARDENREHLFDAEVRQVLEAYGFPTPRFTVAKSAIQAIEFFREINGPVVLKIESPKILHKSDIGGVKVNMTSEEEIEKAFASIMSNALKIAKDEDIEGIMVQEMIKGGREVALGMVQDPNYGPMIMFGLGGIFVEIFKDVIFRIAPVTDVEVKEMIEAIKGYPILAGARG